MKCEVVSNGPCKRCKSKKQGCSLMPPNPGTGKTSRKTMSDATIMEYRIKHVDQLQSEIKKGKRRSRDSPDTGVPEGSGPAPSPLASLTGLKELSLNSDGSSSAITPADSPATLPPPSFPERTAPAPSSPPNTRGASKPSPPGKPPPPGPCGSSRAQHLTGLTVDVPRISKRLVPENRQASHSRSNASPASDDRNYAARIAVLERRQEEHEKLIATLDRRLKSLGG